MATIIRERRDSEANWISNNPVIPDGQFCVDTTNNTIRMGDGVNNYVDLPLVGGSTAPATTATATIYNDNIKLSGVQYKRFGHSVVADSNKMYISEPYNSNGAVYIYNLDGTGKQQIVRTQQSTDDNFGMSMALSSTRLYVGARNFNDGHGKVFSYALDGTDEQEIVCSDTNKILFGSSLAILNNRLLVGAPQFNYSVGKVFSYALDGSGELSIENPNTGQSNRFGHTICVNTTTAYVSTDNNTIYSITENCGLLNTLITNNLSGGNFIKIAASDTKVCASDSTKIITIDPDLTNEVLVKTIVDSYSGSSNIDITDKHIYFSSLFKEATNSKVSRINIDGTNEISVFSYKSVDSTNMTTVFGSSVSFINNRLYIGSELNGSSFGEMFIYGKDLFETLGYSNEAFKSSLLNTELFIDYNNLPKSDPNIYGQIWVDGSNNLKVSAASNAQDSISMVSSSLNSLTSYSSSLTTSSISGYSS